MDLGEGAGGLSVVNLVPRGCSLPTLAPIHMVGSIGRVVRADEPEQHHHESNAAKKQECDTHGGKGVFRGGRARVRRWRGGTDRLQRHTAQHPADT